MKKGLISLLLIILSIVFIELGSLIKNDSIFIGILVYGGILLFLVGFVFGVIGIFKDKKKILSFIITTSCLIIFGIIIRDLNVIWNKEKKECCSCCDDISIVCVNACCPCTKRVLIPYWLID